MKPMKGTLTKARLSSGWCIKLDGAILLDKLEMSECLTAFKLYKNLQAMIANEPIFKTPAHLRRYNI
jgi:hypothetical protein